MVARQKACGHCSRTTVGNSSLNPSEVVHAIESWPKMRAEMEVVEPHNGVEVLSMPLVGNPDVRFDGKAIDGREMKGRGASPMASMPGGVATRSKQRPRGVFSKNL